MKLSNFGSLNLKDFLQGLIFALISAIITYLFEAIQTGSLDSINLKEILSIAALVMITYIGKRFGSNSDGDFLKKDVDPYRSEDLKK